MILTFKGIVLVGTTPFGVTSHDWTVGWPYLVFGLAGSAGFGLTALTGRNMFWPLRWRMLGIFLAWQLPIAVVFGFLSTWISHRPWPGFIRVALDIILGGIVISLAGTGHRVGAE
ncbi:MAG TPA: hypothetical protein VFI39_05770 [Gemmatimonadales bacterium]|nr:hypothetical protein [Gemmatimonadales bacterium]